MLVFLIALATYTTLFTVAAYNLVRSGWAVRGTLGDATFLPFPTGPRGTILNVPAIMSPVDAFIDRYLLKTGILIGICNLIWILTTAYFFKAILPLLRKEFERII